MSEISVTCPIHITLPENRWRWLRGMADYRQVSLAQLVSDILHGETIHFQMDHAPDSDPDDTPQEAFYKQHQA